MGAIAPVPRISAEFERSGPGTCPEFLSRGLGTGSRRRFFRGRALSHRTASSQEGPPPGPRGRSVPPEENARGGRLDLPDSSSSVPLILRWVALILPRPQALRERRGRVGGRRVWDGAGSGRLGWAAAPSYRFTLQHPLRIELSGVRAEKRPEIPQNLWHWRDCTPLNEVPQVPLQKGCDPKKR